MRLCIVGAMMGLALSAQMVAGPALADTILVMFEQKGCAYCRRWDNEVSQAYANSAEGRQAPLRRLDIHDPVPADLAITRPVQFTPTFVLVEDGAEIGRIEGYPGEAFFWGLLDQMLDELRQ